MQEREEQVILRLPQTLARRVRTAIHENNQSQLTMHLTMTGTVLVCVLCVYVLCVVLYVCVVCVFVLCCMCCVLLYCVLVCILSVSKRCTVLGSVLGV